MIYWILGIALALWITFRFGRSYGRIEGAAVMANKVLDLIGNDPTLVELLKADYVAAQRKAGEEGRQ